MRFTLKSTQTFPDPMQSKIVTGQFQAKQNLAVANGAAEQSGSSLEHIRGTHMNNIVYIVGAVVIVLAILSFLGFR